MKKLDKKVKRVAGAGIAVAAVGATLFGTQSKAVDLSSSALEQVVAGSNQIGANLVSKIAEEKASDNIFFSGFSLSQALALVLNGAEKETLAGVLKAANLTGLSVDAINDANHELLQKLNSNSKNFTLSIANGVFAHKGTNPRNEVKLNSSYLDVLRTDYGAEAKSLDFGSEESVKEINGWVAKNTNDKITDITDHRTLAQNVLMLINATYFKADWKRPFPNPGEGRVKLNFAGPSGKSSVAAMSSTADYKHAIVDGVQAIELPYTNDAVSMFVFLPNEKSSITASATVGDVQRTDALIDAVIGSEPERGVVSLPKFKFKTKRVLNEDLKALGMARAFSGSAQFAPLSKNTAIRLSLARQDAFVAVDEKGTEAVAVTIIESTRGTSIGPGPEFRFIADRPFGFVIRDNGTGLILFSGVINQPTI